MLGLAAATAVATGACGQAGAPGAGAGNANSPVGTAASQNVGQQTARSLDAIKANLPADFEINAYGGEDALGGATAELSSVVALGKPVVLNFFAGLCPPCRAEMPHLQEVYARRASEFVLVGVDVGPFTGLGTNEEGKALIDELGVTFPTGSTDQRDVVNRYRVLGMPSTVFITPDGKVLRKWDGALTREKFDELVTQLVRASSS